MQTPGTLLYYMEKLIGNFDDLDKEHQKEFSAYQAALSKMEACSRCAEHKVDVLQEKLQRKGMNAMKPLHSLKMLRE